MVAAASLLAAATRAHSGRQAASLPLGCQALHPGADWLQATTELDTGLWYGLVKDDGTMVVLYMEGLEVLWGWGWGWGGRLHSHRQQAAQSDAAGTLHSQGAPVPLGS